MHAQTRSQTLAAVVVVVIVVRLVVVVAVSEIIAKVAERLAYIQLDAFGGCIYRQGARRAN